MALLESLIFEERSESCRQESVATELRMSVRDSGLPLGLFELLLPRLDDEEEEEVREMKVLELERVKVGCEAPALAFALTTGITMV